MTPAIGMVGQALAVERLLERARQSPRAPAIVPLSANATPGEVWTSADLVRRARRLARGLVLSGAEPGARVALICRSRPEWVLVDVACQLAGLVLVPLFKNELPQNLRRVLELTAAQFAIAEDPWQARKFVEAMTGLEDAPRLFLIDERLALRDGGEFSFAELGGQRPTLLAELEASGAQSSRPDPLEERFAAIDAEACTALACTADEEGNPRCAMVTHGNLTAAVAALEAGLGNLYGVHGVRQRRHLLGVSLSTPIGRTACWASLVSGVQVAFLRASSSLAEDVRAFRPTFVTAVPSVLERARVAVEEEQRGGRGLQGIVARWALGGRSEEGVIGGLRARLADRRLRDAVRARFGPDCAFALSTGAPPGDGTAELLGRGGLPVREAYGMVETTGVTHIDLGAAPYPGQIGHPLPGVEERLGDDGELFVRAAMVTPGYWRDVSATRSVIGPDGWLATGDLVERVPPGGLAVTGRKRNVIVLINGTVLAPRPLEQGLTGDPLIAEALVHGDKRPFLVALVALEPEALEAFARDHHLDGDPARWSRHALVYRRVEQAVARVNAQHPPQAAIRKFAILGQPSSNEFGELVMTNNLRRGVIERKFHSLLETFYAEPF